MFFAVMSTRTQVAYEGILEQMLKVCSFDDVQVVMSDFEQALRNAVRIKLPQAKIAGCNFHFDHVSFDHRSIT